jgi:4-diphosphocytidyl-2-C-methyl-D-erythritol kinase
LRVAMSDGKSGSSAAALAEKAFAKVNLTLKILGRRPDGYHEIESLVAFADVGDWLKFTPGLDLTLSVSGPLAGQAGPDGDNLVIKAAHALSRHVPGLKLGKFTLTKRLPAQAGLGGGSADAAAALRLLARANGLKPDDQRLTQAARETGADVPVCLDPRPRFMRGIGERLSEPIAIPRLFAVLVRPDVALATKDVFVALNASTLETPTSRENQNVPAENRGFVAFISAGANDLEPPAVRIAPHVADALTALRAQPSCLLARMSGSGSACFGIFASRAAAAAAARALGTKHKEWWVKPAVIGDVS